MPERRCPVKLIHRPDTGALWRRADIPSEGLALLRGASGAVELATGRDANAAAYVVPFLENERFQAALVLARAERDLCVGGRRPLPVTVLDERAEIVLGGARLYFTAREPLSIALYAGEASCSVCGDPARDCIAIVCTGCGAVAHEGRLAGGEPRLCFTHRGSCPGCELRREDFAWWPDGPAAAEPALEPMGRDA